MDNDEMITLLAMRLDEIEAKLRRRMIVQGRMVRELACEVADLTEMVHGIRAAVFDDEDE